ncbi:tetratricopeptide repeat protein [Pedobacter sp. PF22-3]|uniref:ATP-binding protein n=1 Tax=Pedobacter sp. PF22-3 TaxID=2994467 RepID=UPI0022467C72|nr:tetratricopeptide repeat-containing sensor histidine kinase [Pedobacter sp. PF22-3]MCX2494343.1 tetratricopeptide repeat protein [Pedobacter sp. PF22-3]
MKKLITPLLLLLLLSCNKEISKKKVNNTNPNYEKAWYFFDHSIPDSSFIYFNKAREDFSNTNDSIGIAKCLINMAIISGDQNDYFGSQEMSLSAIKYLNVADSSEREILSTNYNNLGKVAHQLNNYAEADTFYLKSIKLAIKEKSKIIYIGNLAINLSDQKRFPEALSYFEKILTNKELTQDSTVFPRILTNMSLTRWRQNPQYNPVPRFLKALNIREKKDDLWGQNSSYAHLADYYIEKRSDSALFYTHKMYSVAKKIKSPDDQLQALQKLVKLTPTNESKFFFSIYQKLNDSIQFARNTAKNQFALIRYETEKSKADNLVLQKDNDGKRYQIIILLIGILLLVIVGILWYKKRKQKIELKAKNAIRENQLQTSKKVHDKVANKIYRVMSEVENKDDLNKDHLLDQLEYIYNTSRDISYEITENRQIKTFSQQLSDLFSAYISNTRLIEVIDNEEELWANVQEKTKGEIFIVLLELMNNMKKHSGATSVKIEFKRQQNIISVHYHDNGIGLRQKMTYNNGLTNTETRIKNISGTITFETMDKNGLGIFISFPIH